MSYIGNTLQTAFPSYLNIDDISGSFDGVTTSFALTVGGSAPVPAPVSSNQCLISVGGVVQRPDDTGTEGFRLNSGNIVFSSAPGIGEDFFGVILAGADYVNVGVNFPSGTAAAPSITFDTDLDTGVYNPGANEIGFTTAGVNRVTIDSSGKVGLGTSSPGELLHLSNTSTGGAVGLRLENSEGYVNLLANGGGFQFETEASGNVAVIDSSGNVGIGTTSPSAALHVAAANNSQVFIAATDANPTTIIIDTDAGSSERVRINNKDGALTFDTSNNLERARIDSSGRLLVGTSTARTNFSLTSTGVHDGLVQYETTSEPLGLSLCRNGSAVYLSLSATGGSSIGSTDPVEDDDGLGSIVFSGMNGLGAFSTAALISAEVDAVITASTSEMPGRLVFSTTADGASSPTERMRIANNGAIAINTGGTIYNSGIMSVSSGGNGLCGTFRSAPTSGTVASIIFEDGAGTDCGSIDVNTSANTTAYTTSSDYRLKQDIKPLAGSIGRVLQLKPCEWNWISSPETRGEGFIAHEAQAVVPECATGVKDEIDDEGNPVYQGIDQSKLVPLLTAALQEALAKIETLEARLTAAGL